MAVVVSWVLLEVLCTQVGVCACGEDFLMQVDVHSWFIASGISNLLLSVREHCRTEADQMSP